jgi:para-nitrobenzyl esterase
LYKIIAVKLFSIATLTQHGESAMMRHIKKYWLAIALSLFVSIVLSACGGGSSSSSCTDCVQTEGGWVKGAADGSVLTFRGIPFAAVPVGDLRFKPPQPAESWSGLRNGSKFKAICSQVYDSLEDYSYDGETVTNPLTESETTLYANEDCLYLNVWTQNVDKTKKRPVMVFIHGGAFIVGSPTSEIYSGANLAAKDVVVVSMQYRLGPFGFLELGDLDPAYKGSSNNGLRDQIAALEWVKRNAQAFGGDPDNITIFGESAGSISVAALLGIKNPEKLFKRAIAQSGGASLVHTERFQLDSAKEFFGETLQVNQNLKTMADMKNATTKDILLQHDAVILNSARSDTFYGPYIDGVLLPKDPGVAIAEGNARSIDLMLGSTQDETGYWTMYSVDQSNLFIKPWLPAVGADPIDPVLFITPELKAAVDAQRADGKTLDNIYTQWIENWATTNAPTRLKTDSTWWGNHTFAQAIEMQILHDYLFIQPTLRMVEQQLQATSPNSNAYVYRFQWKVPSAFTPDEKDALGSIHALDTYFMFGTWKTLAENSAPGASKLPKDPLQIPHLMELADAMTSAWVNFARSGNPNGPGVPTWPKYNLVDGSRPTMMWRNDDSGKITSAAANDPDAERRKAWVKFPFTALDQR